MSLTELDSRIGYGTDIERLVYPPTPGSIETHSVISIYPLDQEVRVIVGYLGNNVRMSAPSLELVVEGKDQSETWEKFLDNVKQRDDCAWLRFDVGPTRPEEIVDGLNVPEDEDWSELFDNDEA